MADTERYYRLSYIIIYVFIWWSFHSQGVSLTVTFWICIWLKLLNTNIIMHIYFGTEIDQCVLNLGLWYENLEKAHYRSCVQYEFTFSVCKKKVSASRDQHRDFLYIKAILHLKVHQALCDESYLGYKTTITTVEWSYLISFASASLGCSNRERSKKNHTENTCLLRDSNLCPAPNNSKISAIDRSATRIRYHVEFYTLNKRFN